MIRCSNCQRLYAEDLAECPNCGAASQAPEQVVECERCGEEYAGDDACPACGLLRADRACENHAAGPAVGRCVLCGRALCRDCVVGEQDVTLCEDHRSVPIIQGWAQVYSTTSEVEAGLLRENLLADGINAQVYSQKDMMFNVDLGELSIVRLLVPVWEYAQATRIIREHMDVQGEVAFACSACGEPFEGRETTCAACGAPLI